jgi:hypothetical protein
MYTDGSKEGCKVGTPVFENSFRSSMMLPENVSAIDLAVSYIVQHTHDKFVIFSDSLSVLISINNKKSDNIMIWKLLLRFHDILKTTLFC